MHRKPKLCFVCKTEIIQEDYEYNFEVNMPVCKKCKGTFKEKEKVIELLDSLSEGFVCGCI
ncbi:MAG: hypothetical protein CSA36_07930 [Draconibacterium sp.]|nr:MAG: hypothetical protein CSA36_07930 [Draconibacterium sp.]